MDVSKVTITTLRLTIVPVHERYAGDIFRELTLEVSKYLSFDPTGNIEDTHAFIQTAQNAIKHGKEFPVVVTLKKTGEFIGCAGIHKIHTGKPELGIWLKKSAHRRGYGKEILQGLIDWAKKHLECKYFFYPVAKANLPSRKLIESLGGTVIDEIMVTFPSGKILDEVMYQIY